MRIGIAGSSVVVAGSAAFAALAPAAGAASQFNSTATAKSGNVTIGDQSLPAQSVTATPATGNQSKAVPPDGTSSVSSALGQAIPGSVAQFSGSNLMAVTASATPDGKSNACAAVLAASCNQGEGAPLTYTVPLASLGNILKIAGLDASQDTLKLTVNGPTASCSAGPSGASLVSQDTPAAVQAEIDDANGTVGTPVDLKSGDILSQLSGVPALTSILSGLTQGLNLTIKQGSHQTANGAALASTGELGLSAGSTSVFDLKGGTVSCGPNNPIPGSTPTPPPASPGGNSTPQAQSTSTPLTSGSQNSSPTPKTSSASKKLSKVQTDEGRSASDSAPAWLALNGMP